MVAKTVPHFVEVMTGDPRQPSCDLRTIFKYSYKIHALAFIFRCIIFTSIDFREHPPVCICSAGEPTDLRRSVGANRHISSPLSHNAILRSLPKPHCRTTLLCYFRSHTHLLPLLLLLCASARSAHHPRIITPQRNLSKGCHLIFPSPPQTQSVIRNPRCHAGAIFGARCLLPHFF